MELLSSLLGRWGILVLGAVAALAGCIVALVNAASWQAVAVSSVVYAMAALSVLFLASIRPSRTRRIG